MLDNRVMSSTFGPEKLDVHHGCADIQVTVRELDRLFTLNAFTTLEHSSLRFKHAQNLKLWRCAVIAYIWSKMFVQRMSSLN